MSVLFLGEGEGGREGRVLLSLSLHRLCCVLSVGLDRVGSWWTLTLPLTSERAVTVTWCTNDETAGSADHHPRVEVYQGLVKRLTAAGGKCQLKNCAWACAK